MRIISIFLVLMVLAMVGGLAFLGLQLFNQNFFNDQPNTNPTANAVTETKTTITKKTLSLTGESNAVINEIYTTFPVKQQFELTDGRYTISYQTNKPTHIEFNRLDSPGFIIKDEAGTGKKQLFDVNIGQLPTHRLYINSQDNEVLVTLTKHGGFTEP